MKRKKLLESMQYIDEKYVEEAHPANSFPMNKKSMWVRIVALAACFALLLTGFNLWMFIPFDTSPPDVSQYADSAYYPVIQRLNALTYQKPRYKNNFQKFTALLSNALESGVDMDKNDAAAPEAGGNMSGVADDVIDGASGTKYEETTDNQVKGVIEADIIKRSDRHIFYMSNDTLLVYNIDKEDTALVGSYEINHPDDVKYAYNSTFDFYLSNDCSTVTYLYSYQSKFGETFVRVASLDVTDPTDIKPKGYTNLTGSLISSRLVDGKLLLISEFYVERNSDFSDESTFIPQIDDGNGMQCLPLEDIVFPETLSSTRYTVVTQLDGTSLQLDGSTAFLSYSDQVYVSRDAVYVTRSFNEKTEDNTYTTSKTMTEISRLSYGGNSLVYGGSVTVEGYVKDQYSLDEYEGVLRVVTTTSVSKYRNDTSAAHKELADEATSGLGSTNANLYCISLDTMQVVASKEQFAPVGETVRSVRFDGTSAYVCTSVQLSDPVFFFDLSDLSNITYTDTGTIDGFSSSLVNLGEGFLLGIGVGDLWDTVKIEVYEERDGGVISVAKYEVEHAGYSTDYKSYLIDRERNLVGLGISHHDLYNKTDDGGRYVLLCFDGYRLIQLVNVPLQGPDSYKRATYIDGYLYMFSQDTFLVVQVEN